MLDLDAVVVADERRAQADGRGAGDCRAEGAVAWRGELRGERVRSAQRRRAPRQYSVPATTSCPSRAPGGGEQERSGPDRDDVVGAGDHSGASSVHGRSPVRCPSITRQRWDEQGVEACSGLARRAGDLGGLRDGSYAQPSALAPRKISPSRPASIGLISSLTATAMVRRCRLMTTSVRPTSSKVLAMFAGALVSRVWWMVADSRTSLMPNASMNVSERQSRTIGRPRRAAVSIPDLKMSAVAPDGSSRPWSARGRRAPFPRKGGQPKASRCPCHHRAGLLSEHRTPDRRHGQPNNVTSASPGRAAVRRARSRSADPVLMEHRDAAHREALKVPLTAETSSVMAAHARAFGERPALDSIETLDRTLPSCAAEAGDLDLEREAEEDFVDVGVFAVLQRRHDHLGVCDCRDQNAVASNEVRPEHLNRSLVMGVRRVEERDDDVRVERALTCSARSRYLELRLAAGHPVRVMLARAWTLVFGGASEERSSAPWRTSAPDYAYRMTTGSCPIGRLRSDVHDCTDV